MGGNLFVVGEPAQDLAEVAPKLPGQSLVCETPWWSLRGESRGRKLVGPDGGRWSEPVPLDQPSGVVDIAEGEQRLAELLDGVEGLDPEQVLFQSADEPLGRCR